MNAVTLKSFLIALSSKAGIEQEGLYQLLRAAEASYYLRDTDRQFELGLTLQAFPYPFNQVGRYYEAVCLYRNEQYLKARDILEGVAESVPARYRSKALLSLSAIEETLGHFEEAMKLRLQSASSGDPLTVVEANWGIAVLKSIEGSHRAAIKQLEEFLPMAAMIGKVIPSVYAAHLNSYAVELSEVGRMEEARGISNTLLASPYFNRFSEIRQTVREIYLKSRPASRSLVSFKGLIQNVIALPTLENRVVQSTPTRPAKVFSLEKWKEEKMVKEPNDESEDENVDEMDDKDLLATLIQIAAQEDIDEENLRDVVKYAIKKLGVPKKR